MDSRPESQLSTPWSSRAPSRLDSTAPSRPETPMPAEAQAASDATKHSPLRALLHRALAAATRRENAEMVAGLGLVLVLLVAFLLELTDRNAPRASSSSPSGWGVLSALAAAASKGVVKGGAALQDVCTCAHAEAGLRAAMLACGKKADGSGELVQALLLQTAAQAEALSSLESRLRGAEEASEAAEAATARGASELQALASTCALADSRSPGARSRLAAAASAARERALRAEQALAAAEGAAEDATRRSARLAARLAVAEAELGLLSAEKALTATKLAVAEETLVAAAATCGPGAGALPERAEALRRAAQRDARAASEAVERARGAVAESVARADAAFSASAPRGAHAKSRLWQSRLDLKAAASHRAEAEQLGGGGGGGGGGAGGVRALRRQARALLSGALRLTLRLLWRLRYLALLLAAGGALVAVQTRTEEAGVAGPGGPAGGARPAPAGAYQ